MEVAGAKLIPNCTTTEIYEPPMNPHAFSRRQDAALHGRHGGLTLRDFGVRV